MRQGLPNYVTVDDFKLADARFDKLSRQDTARLWRMVIVLTKSPPVWRASYSAAELASWALWQVRACESETHDCVFQTNVIRVCEVYDMVMVACCSSCWW